MLLFVVPFVFMVAVLALVLVLPASTPIWVGFLILIIELLLAIVGTLLLQRTAKEVLR